MDTTAWLPGHYAYDPTCVTLLPGAPPGDYDVVVRLFVKDTLGLDSVLGPDGERWARIWFWIHYLCPLKACLSSRQHG